MRLLVSNPTVLPVGNFSQAIRGDSARSAHPLEPALDLLDRLPGPAPRTGPWSRRRRPAPRRACPRRRAGRAGCARCRRSCGRAGAPRAGSARAAGGQSGGERDGARRGEPGSPVPRAVATAARRAGPRRPARPPPGRPGPRGPASRPSSRWPGCDLRRTGGPGQSWAPATAARARSVNRDQLPSSGTSAELRGTNRFCAACLVTPMLRPISVQDAPARRAWSTKCPTRWSALSVSCSATSTASERWVSGSPSGCAARTAAMRSSRRTGEAGSVMRQP